MPRRGENIRKRKDGRWEGRYIKHYSLDGKAVYGSVYGKTYFETKKKLNDITSNFLLNASLIKEHEITFREVLFLWLQSNQINLKEQTYAKYLYLVETHILPFLGQIKVKKIESEMINKYLLEKSQNGRLDGKGGLSASYIQTISFIINSALEFSIKEGYRRPLCGQITKPINKTKKTSVEILTVKEQGVLENYISSLVDNRKIGVLLSLYTGLRVGEVCGLRWKDIDFESRTIHIQHTIERVPNVNARAGEAKTNLVVGDAKTTTSNRLIPIPSQLLSELLIYRRYDGFVLQGKTYEYTDPRTYQNFFHKCLKESNIRSINYHALRHTFATRCIEAGVDIKTLSELLGHANVNITLNIYVHSSLEHKRQQLEKVSSIYGQ